MANNDDTLAGGAQAPPLKLTDTLRLLRIRRELEAALAVCDYAVRSYDLAEHSAALRIVKCDVRRACK